MLKVPFRDSNYISRQDWNRRGNRIAAHAGLAAPLDLHCIAVCSICRAASDGHRGEYVEATPVRIFAWLLDLAHHVKGPQRRNRNGDLWISEILGAEFLSQRLLKFGLRQAERLNGSSKRH